ncbi:MULTISPECIES: GSU2403 family nucleotidyltransferase fold protein [unclassified Sphingomonas]|uniref:GSU2403 family nucleotidyltransferase fold protein n=1 Tax=unclassified Sphingomonas TaxID=196159 RepID=UPI0006FBBE47|nr:MULTISPECIES: nucleotidyltransferase domain-containing protein [unclassified Sphingomonas]KRB78790.1 hypothetical protein ASE00_21415 [Sphingomonas sp. Root710]KRB93700.1 hypothetical protein ASE22_25185 [Sphingomonas sp. Root720]
MPVGRDRVDRFVGQVGDPAAEEQAATLRKGGELAKSRRQIVSMPRRHGLAGPDRTHGAALDALAFAGLFKRGAVLVGTGAYMKFEPLIGSRLPAPTLMTGDLDLATARIAIAADPPKRMEDILRRADPTFAGIPQLDPREPSSRYRNAEGYLVDLLTPTRSRTDTNPVALKALSASAVPLQYLDWLIRDPVPTVVLWGAGIVVSVPQPAKFAVHKLILAQRRDPANRSKRAKDLDEARALIDALLIHDRFAIVGVLTDSRRRGRTGWAEPIARSLKEIGSEDPGDHYAARVRP